MPKIEAGKRYITRDGKTVGPFRRPDRGEVHHTMTKWSWLDTQGLGRYTDDGLFYGPDQPSGCDIVAEKDLQLKANTLYTDRSGRTVGPLYFDPNPKSTYPWRTMGVPYSYTQNGRYTSEGDSHFDLLFEAGPAYAASAVEEQTPLKIEEGKLYWNANGEIVGPLTRARTSPKGCVWHDKRRDARWHEDGRAPCDWTRKYDIVEEAIPPESVLKLIAAREAKPVIVIEVGEYYRNRAGDVVGPMTEITGGGIYAYRAVSRNNPTTGRNYMKNGVWHDECETEYDLVEQLQYRETVAYPHFRDDAGNVLRMVATTRMVGDTVLGTSYAYKEDLVVP